MKKDNGQFIKFTQKQEAGAAFAYLKNFKNTVLLTLSLEKSGDVEITLNKEDCEKLIQALKKEMNHAKID
jgi:hypothetical protein